MRPVQSSWPDSLSCSAEAAAAALHVRHKRFFQRIFILYVQVGGASLSRCVFPRCRRMAVNSTRRKSFFPSEASPPLFDLRLLTTCCQVKVSTVCIRDVCDSEVVVVGGYQRRGGGKNVCKEAVKDEKMKVSTALALQWLPFYLSFLLQAELCLLLITELPACHCNCLKSAGC